MIISFVAAAFAQSGHDKISYQSVVRDGSNHLLYDTEITVAVSIANSGNPAVVYSETHTVTSNANGLISFLIGDGSSPSGNWDAVQWNRAEITMVTSVGGVVLSTHTLPLSAVPYALYAKNAGAASYADSVDINVVKHYVDQQGFLTEEVQVLSISNDTIFLTGGSWVKLPAGFSGDYNDLTNKPGLAPVATSGDYNDLTNKPLKTDLCDSVKDCVTAWIYDTLDAYYDTTHMKTAIHDTADALRSLMGDAANNARITIQKNGVEVDHFTVNQSENQSINITVPTTVSELSDAANYVTTDQMNAQGYLTEEIDPTVKDATLTIQKNGAEVGKFTANASADKTINITVPTKVSDLNNDSGFITGYTETDPTVKDSKITIQKNGVDVNSFTLNQSSGETINITVPDAPGTLNTTNTEAQSTSTSEPLSGNVSLHKISKTGSYNDLLNKPDINDATLNIKNGETSLGTFTANAVTNKEIDISSALPTVNNNTVTVNLNGSSAGSFTLNQSSNATVDLNNVVITTASNTFTGTNDFTSDNARITVPSKFDIENRPTSDAPCTQDAVNICDLWAVFDSLTKRMDQMQETINGLRDSLQNVMPKLTLVAEPTAGVICGETPATITYTANITNGNAADYQFKWTVNGTDSTSVTGPTLTCHYTTNNDECKVVCTATRSGYNTLKDSVTITVETGVVPTFSTTVTYLTVSLNSESDIDSIAWGDGTGVKNPSSFPVPHNYSNSGIVTITVYSTTGCTAETDVKLIAPCTGLSSYNNNEVATGEAGNYTITAVSDVQNNQYKVVQLGSQCWMAENLRSTQYSISGGPTLELLESSEYTNGTAYYGYPNNNSQNEEQYGLLYNWKAAMGGSSEEYTQGICPDGWHVPSLNEFETMRTTTASQYAAGKLAGGITGTWISSNETAAPGNYNYKERNVSGFGAMPAGCHNKNWLNQLFRNQALVWSSTEINSDDNAQALVLSYESDFTQITGYYETSCLSVRCVRDVPIVTTSAATGITTNSATLNGSVDANGYTITEKGFIYVKEGESEYDTVSVPVNSDLTYELTNLDEGTYYYFKAYAVANGTYYVGPLKYFKTTPPFVCGVSTVKDNDYDNNGITYSTVLTGTGNTEQCWMAENLRSTKYSSGDELTSTIGSGTYSDGTAYYGYPGGSSANIQAKGLLYNWYAAMGSTEGNQGICPDGWHVPTQDDFNTLLEGNNNTLPSSFTSQQAGCFIYDDYYGELDYPGNATYFWTSSFLVSDPNQAYGLSWSSYSQGWFLQRRGVNGYAVRCILNAN